MIKKLVATFSLLAVTFAGANVAQAGEVFVENYDFIRDSRTETDLDLRSTTEVEGYRAYGADAHKIYVEAGYSTVDTYKATESGDYTSSHQYIPHGYAYSFDGSRTFESASTHDRSIFKSVNVANAWERGIEKYTEKTTITGDIFSVDTEWGSGHRTSAGTK